MLAKRALYAAALAVPLALVASPASADHDVDVRLGIGIGTPHYGYGAYPDGYYPFHRRKMSCWQARRLVRDHGFRRVRVIECNGRVYTFRAFRRGRPVTISVNSRTGAVWRI